MATTNLSEERTLDIPQVASKHVVILVSRWNDDITENLYNGAEETLLRLGFIPSNIHKHYVPGSFELALGAKWAAQLAHVDGVICLGSIIRGETPHFEFVSMATAQGIQQAALETQKPCIFGVLTDDNKQQSLDRSGGKLGNKGVEAAYTLAEMLVLRAQLGF